MDRLTLYQGDCIGIMKKMPDKSVDLICTDIPYELDSHGGGRVALAERATRTLRDSIDFMAHGIDYDKCFSEFIRLCKVPNMLIFCSNAQIGKLLSFFGLRGLKTELLVWEKTNPPPLCNGKYLSDLEYIVYVHDKGSVFNNSTPFTYKKKCKRYPIIPEKGRLHPAQKPFALIRELVEVHSSDGQTVLDPFMGSGTCGEVCMGMERNFIGIELDEEYFRTAEKRIKEAESSIFDLI